MREIRKRLTCANRHDQEKNNIAIHNVLETYVSKMEQKGWIFVDRWAGISSGNSFFQYELYVSLSKPSSPKDFNAIAKSELSTVLDKVEEKGNVTKNGVFVKDELQKRGWMPLSYSPLKHSEFHYDCGYSGNYNFSRMVRVF
ncbi:MAG: hypothetical protein R8K20_11875 [Gallionellaceae bacterium]